MASARGLAQVLSNQTMYEPTGARPSGRAVSSSRSLMSDGSPGTRHGAWTPPARKPSSISAVATPSANLSWRGLMPRSWAKPWATWYIYGLPTVANVLYMTRVTQSVESGFRLATGSFLQDLALDVQAHHLRQAQRGTPSCSRLSKTAKPCARPDAPSGRACRCDLRPGSRTPVLPNPEGDLAAFTTDERGHCGWARWTWTVAHAPGTPRWGIG